MPDDDDQKYEIQRIAGVLASIEPRWRMIAGQMARRLYEHGLRFHPELAEQPSRLTSPQQAHIPPVAQKEIHDRAMATLSDMAAQFPQLRPLTDRIQNARTDTERVIALAELRERIQPALLAQAQKEMVTLRDPAE